jgi:hypothetical protein
MVAMEESSPDIMAINETWLRPGQDEVAPRIRGYRLRHIPRPATTRGGRGGGVGFYIRNGIIARSCQHPVAEAVEQMWLSVRVQGRTVMIGTAYRPPWQDLSVFLDSLTNSITSFGANGGVILLGDFNVNLLDPGSGACNQLTQFLHSVSLTQIVREPTHFTEHSQTLIDIICTDVNFLRINLRHSPDLGGHAMITAVFKVRKDKQISRWVSFRPLRDIVLEQFRHDLDAIDWRGLYDVECIDTLVEAFSTCMVGLFDLHAPVRRKKFKHPPHPWFTDTIKSMMRIRDRYHLKYRKQKTPALKDSYNNMKHIVVSAIETEKRCYFERHINANMKNSTKLWRNLKGAIMMNNKCASELPQFFDNPESINTHFLDVPGRDQVSISQLTYLEYHRYGAAGFALCTVSEDTVLKAITGLKSNAQGTDGIALDMLLLTLPQSLGAVTTIINRSIESHTFPASWKTAVVKPLAKNNQPTTVRDLRPISLLPCLSKVLERVVCNQLTKYLEDSDILPMRQSGFRKGHSTTSALADVTDKILAAQDDGMVTALVLLDFSRAFDSINVCLLLSKLSYYGVDAGTVRWFSSYLENRRQLVELIAADGSRLRSPALPVTRGVPQGSILGPILYILYSADIAREVKHCEHHLYADDMQLYLSFAVSDCAGAMAKLTEDLSCISEWCSSNSLILNPVKSKLMLLGTRKNLHRINSNGVKFSVCIDGVGIELVTVAKNLGLVFDSHLTFESHISECARSCFFRLKLLYKIRPYLSEALRIKLCDSLILSRFNYCDAVYGPCLLARSVKLVQRVQNACARFCFYVPPRSHVTPYHNKANMLRMEARRRLHLASMLFEVITTGKPTYLHEKLAWANSNGSRSRRSCTYVLNTPSHRTMAFRGSFRYAASRCWNDIPPPLRDLKSKFSFKKYFKAHLLKLQKET